VRCENRGIALPTFRKYQTFIKQLHNYCDGKGYVMLDQLGIADMDLFYASWKDGKLKIVEFAPIPIASVRIMNSENPGRCLIRRTP
jgi:hypothetical protein